MFRLAIVTHLLIAVSSTDLDLQLASLSDDVCQGEDDSSCALQFIQLRGSSVLATEKDDGGKCSAKDKDYLSCVSECSDEACENVCEIKSPQNISQECQACFEGLSACQAASCNVVDNKTCDDSCSQCTATRCGPAFLTCTGLKSDSTAGLLQFGLQKRLALNGNMCSEGDKSIFMCAGQCQDNITCVETCMNLVPGGVTESCKPCLESFSSCQSTTCGTDSSHKCVDQYCLPAFFKCSGLQEPSNSVSLPALLDISNVAKHVHYDLSKSPTLLAKDNH